uniref:Peroxin-7 n=1 Tax=Culicoides sonorensis TaxID=179676 RepID=A0A336KR32_CULSO
MPHYKLPLENMHGYAIKFSPFTRNRLAVALSQPYAQIGTGALLILNYTDNDHLTTEKQTFTWHDSLLNICWSKDDPNHILTSSGDGSLQLWDTNDRNLPIQVFKEHGAEVYAIDWTTINQNPQMLSGGWDGKIKLWDPKRKNSIITFDHTMKNNENYNLISENNPMIFDVSFSGGHANLFSSVGNDNCLKIWNLNQLDPVIVVQPKTEGEILTCDWVEKCDNIIGIGASNGMISVYDLRNSQKKLVELKTGNELAVRKIKFSPWNSTVLASVGYDSITRVWDYNNPKEPLNAICQHKDCVFGVDWDPFEEKRLVDCGWDSIMSVFDVKKNKIPVYIVTSVD